jgi:CheY-like chemotaxis protein/anti-sigma regulatory factor (Ser/Thr protein kinase)
VGNATEIREALINLVFNAVDAMPAGGVITLRARKTPGRLLLEVIDTGVGMNAELRQRCLEPFFTTKGAEGSGLGLSVVYGTMQRHQGAIEVESEEGQGTTVRLVFPILPHRPGEGPAEAEAQASDEVLPRLRILCVDDDPGVRTVLTEMLASSGQEVESRGGGEEALAALLSAKAEGKGFDLVITDLGMPHMDGKELARRIKNSSPGTPVILLSGWGSFLAPDQQSDLEVDCLLSKPPTIAALQRAIRKILPRLDPTGGPG